jgi:trimeric autotransporter adhesin
MYNEQFDIFPDNPGYPESVLGLYPVAGNELFRVGGPGSLQGTDAATALVQAINNPSIDDLYTKLLFLVEVPEIKIVPVPDHQIGDTFNISGTTNLKAGDDILVQVVSSSFQPTGKTQSGEFSGTSGTVKVVQGTSEMNTWSFTVDTATFRPDSYIVQVSSVSPEAQASILFNVTGSGPLPVTTGRSVREVSGTDETADNTTPEEEIQESPPDETPGSPEESEENVTKRSLVNIGIRPSTLRNTPVSVSSTIPVSTQTPETVVTTAGMTNEEAKDPTAKPTTQPGFGAEVAVVAGAIGLISVHSRRA